MRCPSCGATEDKVLETRNTNNGIAMRRRRECLKCGYRFTSYERIEDRPIIVIKKDGNHQIFDPKKIERSIRICTDKRNIDIDTIDNLVQNIEDSIKLKAGVKHEISSSEIGEETLRQLYHIDAVAYVRFASVYRAFNNVEQFIEEIEKLKN